ncbi:YdaU family protein [Flagellatimonas centrodinii]|uniref:YdaU family protein n=1 Tax=Flagellatimonas centrodinii TaxID=2806210 RepID=UPI001FEF6B3B|nr:YdaU family protein [Flagellatimonas centrodinii]ULQ47418.1 YdaU family protein [Flagellatimonas centrodinii]
MNYYERHIGDYMKNTAHLSMVEDGAYNRLLDVYYDREKPLPEKVADCCKLARAVTKAEREAVAYVLGEFFELCPDGWRKRRCDAEIERYREKRSKAKRSANARWSAQRSQCDGNANASGSDDADAMRTHCGGNAHQTPDTRHQKPPDGGKARKRARATLGQAFLAELGVPEATARDWLAVRERKRAPLTETAWAGMEREAARAGITAAEAVRICAERGWQGFNADWDWRGGGNVRQLRPGTDEANAVANAEAKRLLGFST